MYVEILLKKLKVLAEEFRQCENRIKKEQMQVTEVCNTLKSFQDNAMHEVERKLWKQVQGMESDLQKLKMLRTALLKVISIYDSCEDAIVSLDEGRQSVDQGLFGNVDLQKYVNIIEKTGIRFK